jgi:hypothetical protein
MSTLKVDTILKRTGTGTITVGQSGDTITIPSGATLSVAGSSVTAVDNTPYFLAERTGSNQTISNATTTTIQYNTATVNEGSCYDNSTYKFTPTTAGVYFFRAKMAWNSATDWDNSEMQLLKNSGSNIVDRYTFSNVFYNSLIVAGTVSLTASDSVYATIYQGSGSGKDLLYGGWSSFTGWKLIA